MLLRSSSPSRFALLISLCAGSLAAPLAGLAADSDYNTRSSPGSSSSVGGDTSTTGNTSSTTSDPAMSGSGNTGSTSSGSSDGTGSYVKDSYITAKVKAALAGDRSVTARNIRVETDGQGVVTLSGTAKSQAEADKAASDARSVDGVTSVVNNIQVR